MRKIKTEIDHFYTSDQNHRFHKKLQKLGFTLDSREVEHPGDLFCRFIQLIDISKNKFHYLEFVHCSKKRKKDQMPGLSLRTNGKLHTHYLKLRKTIPQADFVHKNYDWKINQIDKLPGWNFLVFKKPILKDIYLWFTEYEPSPHRPKYKTMKKKHKNTVQSLYGIELELTLKSKKYLEKVIGVKLLDKNLLPDGTYLFIRDGRKDRFLNVILSCQSMKKAKNLMKKERIKEFENQPAIVIENKSTKGWNILIIEEKLEK